MKNLTSEDRSIADDIYRITVLLGTQRYQGY